MKNNTHRSFIVLATVFAALLVTSAQARFLWAERIASNGSWPEGEANVGLALDTNDNCYVTGFFDGTNDFGGVILTNQSADGSDVFVAKYNSNAALQWVQRAGGTFTNYGRAINVDANGNIYVTGGYQGPASFDGVNLPATSGEQFFLAKYDSAGAVQWVRTSTGGSDDNYGIGLAVDSAGDSYALAVMDHSGTSLTFGSKTVSTINGGHTLLILVKYDHAGVAQWAQLFESTEETYGSKLAVDAVGNVYVRGTFESDMTIESSNLTVSTGSTRNMFLAKLDGTGALTWVQHPTGGNVDEGGVAVDPAGNVYTTGWYATNLYFGAGINLTNAGPFDAFLAKYNGSGAIQWARQAGGTNGAIVNGAVYSGLYFDVALDKQDNPCAAGILPSTTLDGSGVAVVSEYSPAGTIEWADAASGPPGNPLGSVAAKCALDSNGNGYLAGWYQGTATFGTNVLQPQGYWNYFLAKVAPPTPPTLGITLANGFPRLSITGDIGTLFSLQRSPTLASTNTSWQSLTTLTITNHPQFYLDTSIPSGTDRFYRTGPPSL